MMLNTFTWLAWVVSALILLSATRNPLHLTLLIAWLALVWRQTLKNSAGVPLPFSPFRIGAVIVFFSALFNAAMVHVGTTVLFRLPADWLLVGGAITLEAALYGALNGVVLGGFLLAFSILNQTVPVNALVRVIPRAFQPVAVVMSIAITFVPTTLRQFRQIKEAQAVRGHQPRGLRDWLPLFLPLLVGGLERALNLAEAMTARGFAGANIPRHADVTRMGMVFGLGLILLGWATQLLTDLRWGVGAVLAGIALVVAALWVTGNRVPHTTYRRQVWRGRDWLALAAVAIPVGLALLPVPGINREALIFYPYPTLTTPAFSPILALAGAGLLAPIVWLKPESTVSLRMTSDE